MDCPDCLTKMESQDASALSGAPGETKIVAANYYCPECEEYYRWRKGEPLSRASTKELTEEQEAHAFILRNLHGHGAGPER